MKLGLLLACNVVLSNATPEFLRSSNQRKEQEICESTGEPTPPKTSTCWRYNAGTDQSQTGCDNQSCEEAVCACDMYCCTTSWDLNCRGHLGPDNTKLWDNYFTPGCSASILCCEKKDFEETQVSMDEEINVVQCPSGGTAMGYVDIESLKEDMAKDYVASTTNPKDKYEYVLCPDTTFDLSGLTASNSTTVLLSNTEIKCGVDGSSSNNCKFVSGEHHLIFHPDLLLKDVLIEGIKFSRSKSTSIIAWAQTDSSATFRDCHWEDNNGYTLIDIYPSHKQDRRLSSDARSLKFDNYVPNKAFNSLLEKKLPVKEHNEVAGSNHVSVYHDNRRVQEDSDIVPGGGMMLRINDSLLSSNELTTGLILNVAGVVDITKTSFALNDNQAVGVGVSDGGTLILDTDSDFVKNKNGFSTIYLDHSSKLRIINKHENSNDQKIGLATSENEGMRCSGIFVEDEDSECLDTGGFDSDCYGICCDFALQCFNA